MKNSFLTVEDLKQLPLTYNFFVSLDTKNVKEFYLDNLYGSSKRHHSKFYPIRMNYKPVSLILDE